MRDSEPRRRRSYTFRLAHLLFVVTVVAVGLAAYLGWLRAKLANIDGVWELVSINCDEEASGDINLRLEGNDLVMLDYKGREVSRSRFTINTYRSPPTMDVTDASGKVYQCIYNRSGDMLTVCMPGSPGMPRPTSFDDPRLRTSGDVGLCIFKRVNDGKKLARQ